jgi:glycosyltransferase involved in cell wall biosynthesis
MTETEKQPLVSVVIPCRNAAATIDRALRSVRAQTYAPLEIILVDDASTDETAARLAAWQAPDLRVLRLPRNGGAAAARNAGIAEARGTFVAFLDADDEWLPEKLARQVAALAAQPAAALIGCRSRYVRNDGGAEILLHGDRAAATGTEAWRVLLAHSFLATPTVVVRRAALERVGGFDAALPLGEDQDLWIRLALIGAVAFIDQPLVRVHQQSGGLSGRHPESDADIVLPMLRRHVAALRPRLTRSEVRRIFASRYGEIGRNLYPARPLRGFGLIARAILLGDRPGRNLLYLSKASPPARAIKTWLTSS